MMYIVAGYNKYLVLCSLCELCNLKEPFKFLLMLPNTPKSGLFIIYNSNKYSLFIFKDTKYIWVVR